MNQKQFQSESELRQHFEDQLAFLEQSSTSFDRGYEGEAKRLAVSIRVLLHDKGQSRSLLGQLGLKDTLYWDTSTGFEKGTDLFDITIVAKFFDGVKAKYCPVFDKTPVLMVQTEFEKWWNTPVIRDAQNQTFTRKDLVLYVADQDGGAHVDPALDERYAALSRNNSLGWSYYEGAVKKSLGMPERASIRQITHELLKTFKPDYASPAALPGGGMYIGPITTNIPGLTMAFRSGSQSGLTVDRPSQSTSKPAAEDKSKVGRNDSCPCGSGKKYKKCHGR